MKSATALLGLVLTVGAAGCQCCIVTDGYAYLIDQVADQELQLDALYHPELDLTRIGWPDWCRCRFNRWWCRACRTGWPPAVGHEVRAAAGSPCGCTGCDSPGVPSVDFGCGGCAACADHIH